MGTNSNELAADFHALISMLSFITCAFHRVAFHMVDFLKNVQAIVNYGKIVDNC